jgi:hypothetical protein
MALPSQVHNLFVYIHRYVPLPLNSDKIILQLVPGQQQAEYAT